MFIIMTVFNATIIIISDREKNIDRAARTHNITYNIYIIRTRFGYEKHNYLYHIIYGYEFLSNLKITVVLTIVIIFQVPQTNGRIYRYTYM